VIRYEGPKGGPAMREIASTTAALSGQAAATAWRLITDGRFSGGTAASASATSAPSAGRRPIALIKDGDIIAIDADAGRIS